LSIVSVLAACDPIAIAVGTDGWPSRRSAHDALFPRIRSASSLSYSCWKARISSRATRNVKVFTSLVLFYASIISHFMRTLQLAVLFFSACRSCAGFSCALEVWNIHDLTEKQPIERDDCRLTAVKFSVHLRIAQSFCCAFPHTTDESQ